MCSSLANSWIASQKVIFLVHGPLVVSWNSLHISLSNASLSDTRFLLFASSQMLMAPTVIGWLALSMSSITSLMRSSKTSSDSAASTSSSETSSVLIACFRCAAFRRDNMLLICFDVLHSSGINGACPSSFLRGFISLANCTGSDLLPVLIPSSNCSFRKSFDFFSPS